jgi:hypothetical protein
MYEKVTMIRIPCRACGGILEVPQDLAGSEYQCPHCKLLCDIPSLHELKQINEDGTYVLNEVKREEDPYHLAEMIHVYGKEKLDAQGNEKDLRGPTAEEDKLYHIADESNVRPPPRYDPETGELIVPLDVKPNPKGERVDPSTIPMAQPAIGYADHSTTQAISTRSALVGLARPINIVVILLVFVLHVVIALVLMGCAWLGYFIGIPFMFIFLMMLIAHWANVVDEVGRQDRDEIPRPFRDMQWYEDLWQPFCAIALSMFICYGPELILRHYLHTPRMQLLLVPLWLAQSFFFPAVFLIASTSGSLENLRPDRIWGTVTRSGSSYAIAVALWTIAGTAYNVCLWLILYLMEWAANHFKTLAMPFSLIIRWEVLLPALLVTIYLMHFFCWHLGLIYREHHRRFPWVFQYHQRKSEEPFGAVRSRRRKAPIPRGPRGASVLPQKPLPPLAPVNTQKNQWPQIQG